MRTVAVEAVPVCQVLPGGSFHMGCTPDDKFGCSHELPRREIDIAPFGMGIHPVRESEYRTFAGGVEALVDGEADLPAVEVSWTDAVAYCEWLSERTGEQFRLPTEAEWEYACRAGASTPFPEGHHLDLDAANLLHDERGNRVGAGRRLAVGGRRPNAFGLCDLLGNVNEWVADDWVPHYTDLASDGRAQSGNSGLKIVRGGGWDAMPRLARCSHRDALPPATWRDNLGFRVATTL